MCSRFVTAGPSIKASLTGRQRRALALSIGDRHREHALRREVGAEAAAAPRLALDREARVVAVEHVLDDRETEAGAAIAPRAACGDAIEALREPVEVLLLDADAGVDDLEVPARVVAAP